MKNELHVKNVSTVVLRGVVIFIGLVVLGLCIFALPAGLMSEAAIHKPLLAGLYIPAVPFFYALYQALKLLDNIDRNDAFSVNSMYAFKYIKYCAYIVSGLFLLGSPYVYYVADRKDAPGVLAMALVIIFASFVIGTFSAVMQKLVQSAVEIKSENDLTV